MQENEPDGNARGLYFSHAQHSLKASTAVVLEMLIKNKITVFVIFILIRSRDNHSQKNSNQSLKASGGQLPANQTWESLKAVNRNPLILPYGRPETAPGNCGHVFAVRELAGNHASSTGGRENT
jgi:hypothetical protein